MAERSGFAKADEAAPATEGGDQKEYGLTSSLRKIVSTSPLLAANLMPRKISNLDIAGKTV